MKRLVGPRTSSHGGKYVVRRKGLLDEIPHVRLIRGVIIVKTEDAGKVAKFLREMAAEVHMRTVLLSAEDAREFGRNAGARSPSRQPDRLY